MTPTPRLAADPGRAAARRCPRPSRAVGQAEPQPTRELQAVFSSTTPGGIVTDVFVEVTDGPDGAEAVIEVSRYRSDLCQ